MLSIQLGVKIMSKLNHQIKEPRVCEKNFSLNRDVTVHSQDGLSDAVTGFNVIVLVSMAG